MTATKEQIEEFVKVVREFGDGTMSAEVIVTLADQRAELVALLRGAAAMLGQADELIRDEVEDTEDDDGYAPIIADINALFARIGVTK